MFKFNRRRTFNIVAAAAFALALGCGAAAVPADAATAPSPPFTECPPIGASPSCEILLVVNADNSVSVLGDPSVGTFDGSDDTLVGIVNDSATAVNAVTVSGPGSDLSGFDGDGICSGDYGSWNGSAQCPYGPTGYEGPGTSFVTDPSLPDSAEVDFTGGLAPGASAYFSLEGALTSAELTAREGPLKNLPDLVTVATATTPQGRFFGQEYDKYQVTVNNSGNATATGTVLTITVPSDYLIGFASSPQGDSCSVSRGAKFEGGTITCTLGSLAVGDTADVSVTLIPDAVGADPILAAATETETDENPADNDFSLSFGSCEVQTLATHLNAIPGLPIYHTFILYTAADGTKTGFRGGPNPAPGVPGYGDILVESAPYQPGFIDYTPGAPAATDLLGPGACGTDASFQATVAQINAAHIKYVPTGPNSNSVAFTMLANAKLPEDKPVFIAPGWGELLK
jgi:hypothetical protein